MLYIWSLYNAICQSSLNFKKPFLVLPLQALLLTDFKLHFVKGSDWRETGGLREGREKDIVTLSALQVASPTELISPPGS